MVYWWCIYIVKNKCANHGKRLRCSSLIHINVRLYQELAFKVCIPWLCEPSVATWGEILRARLQRCWNFVAAAVALVHCSSGLDIGAHGCGRLSAKKLNSSKEISILVCMQVMSFVYLQLVVADGTRTHFNTHWLSSVRCQDKNFGLE